MGNQRRVRDASVEDNRNEDEKVVPFDDIEVLFSDEATWVLVGETWVDTSRIISVGPLASIWDDEQGAAGIPEPTGGVAVHVDSPHPDTQFVQSEDDDVETIMRRIIEATTDDE